ncbi:unnamed protein product [Clonostachys byssicola]|uniref:Heterokaryon incompatibility domain-containing protein n=1 Tax=Clonostachys byssicola TaxID=160290 RepID=A0A9N9UGH0_9HYPO|nr:unnamed protein product [Clonostachys byssicola]
MGSTSASSIYQPLSEDRTIRLLHLLPGQRDDHLVGSLEQTYLNSNTKYEALSYEWGPPQRTHQISLTNGASIRITQSLFNALKDLRPFGRRPAPRLIWADGVCINQDDVEERQRQVSIMGSIYRTAARVVVYIGPESEDSSMAIDFALELLRFAKESPYKSDARLHLPDQVQNLGLPSTLHPCWQALKFLLLRGWASRCWCAHEFLMNPNTVIMCGRKTVQYAKFLPDIVHSATYRELPIFTVPSNEEDANSLRECHNKMGRLRQRVAIQNGKLTLDVLLREGHPFLASDPRDKVYSMLSFAQDRACYDIHVDYTCTVASLFITVAGQIIQVSNSLELLSSNLPNKAIELPSWVPDWSTWKYGSHGNAFEGDYMACGDTTTNAIVDDSSNSLIAAGCIADEITWVDDVSIGSAFNLLRTNGRRDWLLKMEKEVTRLQQYHPSMDDDVLWRTLVGNFTDTETPAPSSYKSNYLSQLNFTEGSPIWMQQLGQKFCDAARRKSRYRRLCKTAKGYLGAVVETARPGDYICMLEGSRSLHVIRPAGLDYAFIGPAYVHGLMYGELLKLPSYSRSTITLV